MVDSIPSFHSFLFPVEQRYFPALKIIRQPEINVNYKVYDTGQVEITGITVDPAIVGQVSGWNNLIAEIQEAANQNSLNYKRPGDWIKKEAPHGIDEIIN